jgi:RNA polymerase sigma factor (TIGR02999 family)
MADLAQLLADTRGGNEDALKALLAFMYADLRALAHSRLMKSRPFTIMDTTALVNESCLRLIQVGRLDVADRAHFLTYAAREMRSIIVDLVRQQQTARRGGDAAHITLNTDVAESTPTNTDEVLRISEALDALAQTDQRLVQVVEMRYFAGLSEKEISDALGLNERTVRRDWKKARMLLAAALE